MSDQTRFRRARSGGSVEVYALALDLLLFFVLFVCSTLFHFVLCFICSPIIAHVSPFIPHSLLIVYLLQFRFSDLFWLISPRFPTLLRRALYHLETRVELHMTVRLDSLI